MYIKFSFKGTKMGKSQREEDVEKQGDGENTKAKRRKSVSATDRGYQWQTHSTKQPMLR